MSKFVKVQVFCPKENADDVRLVIGKAGAGKIGNYDYCAFVSEGYGYFRPLEKANPHIGKKGEIEKVKEVKIEFICEKEKLKNIVRAIKQAHPYEEVPIDVFELLDIE